MKKLNDLKISDFYRVDTDDNFLGVCAGIAYFLGVKTWIVRIVFVLLIMLLFQYASSGLILFYILLGILAPKYKEVPEDYKTICE